MHDRIYNTMDNEIYAVYFKVLKYLKPKYLDIVFIDYTVCITKSFQKYNLFTNILL